MYEMVLSRFGEAAAQTKAQLQSSRRRYSVYARALKHRDKRMAALSDLENGKDAFFSTGFPRTGNTYLTYVLGRCYPSVAFGHHLHMPLAIEIALNAQLACYVNLRAPAESVPSLVLHNAHKSSRHVSVAALEGLYGDTSFLLAMYTREYVNYYAYVLRHEHRLKVLASEQVFNDVFSVVRMIGEENGLSLADATEATCAAATDAFWGRKTRQGSKNALSAGIPTEDKRQAKLRMNAQLQGLSSFREAERLYEVLKAKQWRPSS